MLGSLHPQVHSYQNLIIQLSNGTDVASVSLASGGNTAEATLAVGQERQVFPLETLTQAHVVGVLWALSPRRTNRDLMLVIVMYRKLLSWTRIAVLKSCRGGCV